MNKTEQTEKNNNIDYRFNVSSYKKFLIDHKNKNYTKLCMTEIINADISIASFGEERYILGVKEALDDVNLALKAHGLDQLISIYSHTYKNFMMVANDDISDEQFVAIIKGFHDQFELVTTDVVDVSGISRFVVVLGAKHMVDRAKSALYVHRNEQHNFILVSNERELMQDEMHKNVEMFELVSYSIAQNTVLPFYQGIYNNETGKIDKYEALMRIFDKDGNIHSPGMFLKVAKTFKLYGTISRMLIDKALTDFKDSIYNLGINISMYDIKSDEFRQWFIERLKRHPDPTKIVVEFVETENYNTNKFLMDFVISIRELGCRIAIDDFGVGFATYSSIISVKPDIIKIDGDIVKNVINNEENMIILDSICYMAKLINAKLVAEFVENEQIQAIIAERGIEFSQGYYFAKPKSFHELILG